MSFLTYQVVEVTRLCHIAEILMISAWPGLFENFSKLVGWKIYARAKGVEYGRVVVSSWDYTV